MVVFYEDGRIAQLIHVAIRRAAHRGFQWRIGAFPLTFRTQYLYGFGLLPCLLSHRQIDRAQQDPFWDVTHLGPKHVQYPIPFQQSGVPHISVEQ